MSLSLAAYASVPYQGTPFAIPMQVAHGVGALCVPLSFNWLVYGASSQNQNIVVDVNLGGNTVRAPLDLIRSIYIDNTNSPVPVYVQFIDTGFTITAQPYSTGWYPAFTNNNSNSIFKVAAFGFVTGNIPQTRLYITNVFAPPFTDIALPSALMEYLASPVIGGGSSILSIIPLIQGQSYVNGNLTISGGGGNGATAQGTLDQWGRFTSVNITNPGTGYIGQPVITPTGANPVAANFVAGSTVNINAKRTYLGTEWQFVGPFNINTAAPQWQLSGNYLIGNQVSQNGLIYSCNTLRDSTPQPPNPGTWTLVGSQVPTIGENWNNSGTPGGTNAQFQTILSVAANPIASSGFAPPTLGDQAQNVYDTVANGALGVFRHNLWGTPYASGFIYLKSINVKCLFGTVECNWQVENANGYSPYQFEINTAMDLLQLSNMNQKLDATVEWRLNMTISGAQIVVSHGWCWTYSQQ